MALVERTAALLEVPVITTDLEIASASYERQISELAACDDDTAAYVARLEADADEGDSDDELIDGQGLGMADLSEHDAGELVEELEQFLRDRHHD